MSQTRSFYSIMQYVPDSGRAEAANVGVVLFVPAERRIEIRTSPNLERVRKFFAPGKPQLQRVQLGIEALKNRLYMGKEEFTDESAFAQFVAARADVVRLTAPRLAMISAPVNDLNDLYAELVGDVESARQLADAMEILPSRVAEVLGRLEARLEWHKQSVDVNTLDLSQVWKRMDVAHDYMWDCFNAALSPSTLNLFEPIHETNEN